MVRAGTSVTCLTWFCGCKHCRAGRWGPVQGGDGAQEKDSQRPRPPATRGGKSEVILTVGNETIAAAKTSSEIAVKPPPGLGTVRGSVQVLLWAKPTPPAKCRNRESDQKKAVGNPSVTFEVGIIRIFRQRDAAVDHKPLSDDAASAARCNASTPNATAPTATYQSDDSPTTQRPPPTSDDPRTHGATRSRPSATAPAATPPNAAAPGSPAAPTTGQAKTSECRPDHPNHRQHI